MSVESESVRPSSARATVVALLVLCVLALVMVIGAGTAGMSAERAGPAVRISNGPRPGTLDIRPSAPVTLAPDLRVERQRADGSFEPVRNLDLGSMRLAASCGQPARTCVSVGASGLRPVPWSGMSCSSQCNRTCDKNVRLSGRFRFVATSCDGRTRYEGAVFTMR